MAKENRPVGHVEVDVGRAVDIAERAAIRRGNHQIHTWYPPGPAIHSSRDDLTGPFEKRNIVHRVLHIHSLTDWTDQFQIYLVDGVSDMVGNESVERSWQTMTEHQLLAGAASLDLLPPLGMTMVGHLRRSVPAQRYGAPLQVGALVLDDSHERLVIVSADVIATPGTYATRLHEAIAHAADTVPSHVLVNSSHSHAAPPLPGMPKLGGLERWWTESELRFPETLIELASSVVSLAVSRLRPARVGAARVEASDLSVNRRQRGLGTRDDHGLEP